MAEDVNFKIRTPAAISSIKAKGHREIITRNKLEKVKTIQ